MILQSFFMLIPNILREVNIGGYGDIELMRVNLIYSIN
ncbi:MAG: hypothetical protein K0S01_1636 [Herbinix sp.]|jgi:hypothetical protein|nr:hypothetical protein [Herbinix sp.]